MKNRWQLLLALAALALATGPAVAQSPDVLYSWDHSIGLSAGPNVENWSGGGTNVPTLSNNTDGILTVTESVAGGSWYISEDFGYVKESAANTSGGYYYNSGGSDWLGLDYLEFDVTNNATQELNGKIFLQPDNGTGCCGYFQQDITVPAGGGTIKADLNAILPTAADMKYVRAYGFEIYGNAEAAPVTWEFSEVRTTGTPLSTRVIADYSSGGLENTQIDYDGDAIINGANKSQSGLSNVGGALRWVDKDNGPNDDLPSGGTVAWGNNNAIVENYSSKLLDVSNYDHAEITMRIQPGAGADATLGLQLYNLHVDRGSANEYSYASSAFVALVDDMEHTYKVPLADLGGDQDLVQWIGLDLFPHNGNMQVFISKVELTTVPEPGSVALLALGAVGLVGRQVWRRHSGKK